MSVQNGSVQYYTKGKYETIVNFPEKDVACRHCPYCRYRITNGSRIYICSLTYETLISPGRSIGALCQLKFKKEE